jgi:hypothetical protein
MKTGNGSQRGFRFFVSGFGIGRFTMQPLSSVRS